MKIKTADLTGPALDWAVAKCEGVPLVYRGRKWPTDGAATIEYAPWSVNPVVNGAGPYVASLCREQYSPSVDWSQGGPIIERKGINLSVDYQDDALSNDMVPIGWKGNLWNNSVPGTAGFLQWAYGPTPLIAAMRCLIVSRLGDEVDVPEELL